MAEAKVDGNADTSNSGNFIKELGDFVNGAASISSADGSDTIEQQINGLYIKWRAGKKKLPTTRTCKWETIKRMLRSDSEKNRDMREQETSTSTKINELLASYENQGLLIQMRGLNIALQHWKEYEDLAIGCITKFQTNVTEKVYWEYIFSKPATGSASESYTNPLAVLIYSSADHYPCEMRNILTALKKHVQSAFGTNYIYSILYALYYTYSDEPNDQTNKRKTRGETKRPPIRSPLESLKLRTKWLIFLNYEMSISKLYIGSPEFKNYNNYALAQVQTYEADENDVFEITNLNEMGKHVYRRYVENWSKNDQKKPGWTAYPKEKIWLNNEITYWTSECWDQQTEGVARTTAETAGDEAKAKKKNKKAGEKAYNNAYDKAYAQCVRSHVNENLPKVFVKGTLQANDRLFLYLPDVKERREILGRAIFPNRGQYIKRLGKITLKHDGVYWKITNGISNGPTHKSKKGTRAHKESIYFQWYNEFMWVCKRWFKQTDLDDLPRLVCA